MRRLPENNVDKDRPPFVFTLFQKCKKYGIDYGLMCELNFNDLLALIVEYDIVAIKDYFKELQNSKNEARGVMVRKATPEKVAQMHGRTSPKKKEVS